MSATPDQKRNGIDIVVIGLVAGGLLFGLSIVTAVIILLPTLARQWNVASGPGEDWSPPIVVNPGPTSTPLIRDDIGTPTPMTTPDSIGQSGTFAIGDQALNANPGPVNLRRTPGYLNKPTDDRVALVPSENIVLIVDGPEDRDDLVWWRVQWTRPNGKTAEGWMAERRGSGAIILKPIE